jgi:alkylation response protein AidB-like acyl-CoA dehydrogenase
VLVRVQDGLSYQDTVLARPDYDRAHPAAHRHGRDGQLAAAADRAGQRRARLLGARHVAAVAAGLPAETEIATAKFWAAEGGHRVAHTAVHIHGGVGIDMDGEIHGYFAAAKHNEFALGGATAQLRRIGAALAAGA